MARKSTKTEEMANETVVEVVNTEVEQTEDIVEDKKEAIEQVKEVSSKEKELEEKNRMLEEQMRKMQEMIMQMQSNQNAIMGNALASTQNNQQENNVYIQSYCWEQLSINGISFQKYNDIVTVQYDTLSRFLNREVRDWLEKGLIAFVNGSEYCYNKQVIRKPEKCLTKEYIKEIYSKPRKEAFEILDEITKHQKDEVVTLNVFWNTISMFVNNELDMVANQVATSYFKKNIQNAMAQYIFMRESGYVK